MRGVLRVLHVHCAYTMHVATHTHIQDTTRSAKYSSASRVNDHIEDTLRWEKPASGERPRVLGFWS